MRSAHRHPAVEPLLLLPMSDASTVTMRFAEVVDVPAIGAIVNHYIANDTSNLRLAPQSEAEWEKDLLAYRDRYPWLVAEDGGEVAGVAYAKPWNPREAYDWTAESTIYVAKDHGGKRIGRKLYGRLFELLERQGFRSVMAQVTQPNPGSEKLHAAFGFERLGVIRGAGYKHGRWLDVCLWQKELTDPGDPPASPTPVER
jgi:phosphinothricin acetyltransferase